MSNTLPEAKTQLVIISEHGVKTAHPTEHTVAELDKLLEQKEGKIKFKIFELDQEASQKAHEHVWVKATLRVRASQIYATVIVEMAKAEPKPQLVIAPANALNDGIIR